MPRLSVFIFIAIMASACGKKGALIYPDQLVPESPKEITLRQNGQGMKLSFLLPRKDLAGRPLTDLAGIKILKRETGKGEECDACAEAFRTFKTIYADVQGDSIRRYGNTVIMYDPDVKTGFTYSYVLVPFIREAADGQKSRPIKATMVQPPPPPALKVIAAPTEIILQPSTSAQTSGVFLGYNLFRAAKGESFPFIPFNKHLLTDSSYADSGLDRRQTYSYGARTVVQMPTGELVESDLSKRVDAALKNEE